MSQVQHLFFIDSLEKLNIKKDSSLFWATTLKKQGEAVFLLFAKDFYVTNDLKNPLTLQVYEFDAKLRSDFYIDHVTLMDSRPCVLQPGDCCYLRLDPPFNESYLHALWLLRALEARGVRVTNSPRGVLLHQEKLTAYLSEEKSLPSFVGKIGPDCIRFLEQLQAQGFKEFIVKPLNSFSGIDVHKFSVEDHFEDYLKNKTGIKDYFVLQPFLTQIYQGEFRSLFWQGKHWGTIIKKPKEGGYLTNVAQGGSFTTGTLTEIGHQKCETLAKMLFKDGVDLVAFDVIGDIVSEANITCPGLFVEVSHALGKNILI